MQSYRRLVLTGVAALMSLSAPTFASDTSAAPPGTFEALATGAVALNDLVRAAQASVRACGCLADENAKKACEAAKQSAGEVLKKGQRVHLPFGNRAIALGEYEEKDERFTLTMEGGVLAESDASGCPSDVSCAEALESRGLAAPGTRIEITTQGQQTWRGFVKLSPEQAAQLEEVPSRLIGEAVYELAEWNTKSSEQAERANWKAQQAKALSKEIGDLKAQLSSPDESRGYVRELIKQAEGQLACLKKADTRSSTMTVTLRPVAYRVGVRDPRFPDYLVSEPPSSAPRAK